MKIIISDQESYEIKTTDTLTKDQFIGLMDRLEYIKKIVSRDMITPKMISDSVEQDNNNTTQQSRGIDMERKIQLVKEYDKASKDQKQQLALKYGYRNKKSMGDAVKYMKTRYKINSDTNDTPIEKPSIYPQKNGYSTNQKEKTTLASFDTKEKAIKFFNEFYKIKEKYGNRQEGKALKIEFAKQHGFTSYSSMKVVITNLKEKYHLRNDATN